MDFHSAFPFRVLLREPLFVQILAFLYATWVATAAIYTVSWTFGGPQLVSSDETSRLADKSRFWYLNMWSGDAKRLWIVVSFSVAFVMGLGMFVRGLAR
jgi:hypothetical protein